MKQVMLFVWWTLKAVSALPSASRDTTAYFGGDAHFSCSVQDHTGVQQVTWQRIHKDQSVENLATYSKRFGSQINDPYHGKVEFTEASIGSSSITVKNLTWADDACYICSFSVYPSGSKTRETCLSVQGISKVETQVGQIHDNELLLSVSCSGTGKPVPRIQLITDGGLHPSNTTDMTNNADRTFTTSSSLLLRVGTLSTVECVVNGDTASEERRVISIPTLSGGARETEEQDSGGGNIHKGWLALIPVVIVITCVSGMFFYQWKLKRGPRMAFGFTKEVSVV